MQIQHINKTFHMTEQHKTELQQVLRESLGDVALREYIYLAFELGASFVQREEKILCSLVKKTLN